MKLQISFVVKKIRSEKFRLVFNLKRSLWVDFEIQERNHNNKSSKSIFKEKISNKTWQLYQESEIIKHASSTKLIEKTRKRKEIDYLLHKHALLSERIF